MSESLWPYTYCSENNLFILFLRSTTLIMSLLCPGFFQDKHQWCLNSNVCLELSSAHSTGNKFLKPNLVLWLIPEHLHLPYTSPIVWSPLDFTLIISFPLILFLPSNSVLILFDPFTTPGWLHPFLWLQLYTDLSKMYYSGWQLYLYLQFISEISSCRTDGHFKCTYFEFMIYLLPFPLYLSQDLCYSTSTSRSS